ncbi:MAG: helix-hairpin-helix domain-containing protein [Planctomycetes bacterium]|nr:helix-hairpin-helix domain-containing protein [Planctomycetota bacterium]
MQTPPNKPNSTPRWLLRRADQAAVAVLVLAGLGTSVGWWLLQGGWEGRLVEIDRPAPEDISFQVDVNQAEWPELAQLPGIGETLARRIVEFRDQRGPFLDHQDIRNVKGIGPKKLEQIEPYLIPMPQANALAGGS